MGIDSNEFCARQSATDDIIKLLSIYHQLGSDAKENLLCEAARALAAQHVQELKATGGAVLDADEWLTGVARSTYPKNYIAADLLAFAPDMEPDWESMVFSEGWLAPVLCLSENVQAEGLYEGYMYVRQVADYDYRMPEPAKFFDIEVSKDPFSEYSHEKGWVLNKVEWEYEVRRQCIQKFESMVLWWRQRFFTALLAGERLTRK